MKLLITRNWIIGYISVILFLSGCTATRYNSFKPISPEKAADLMPTLSWKAPESDLTVDLAIWEGVKKKDDRLYMPGPMVYYKKNLSGESHTVERKLKPNCRYLWSIKKSGTDSWATAEKPSIPIPGFTALYIVDILTEDMERSGFLFELETSDK